MPFPPDCPADDPCPDYDTTHYANITDDNCNLVDPLDPSKYLILVDDDCFDFDRDPGASEAESVVIQVDAPFIPTNPCCGCPCFAQFAETGQPIDVMYVSVHGFCPGPPVYGTATLKLLCQPDPDGLLYVGDGDFDMGTELPGGCGLIHVWWQLKCDYYQWDFRYSCAGDGGPWTDWFPLALGVDGQCLCGDLQDWTWNQGGGCVDCGAPGILFSFVTSNECILCPPPAVAGATYTPPTEPEAPGAPVWPTKLSPTRERAIELAKAAGGKSATARTPLPVAEPPCVHEYGIREHCMSCLNTQSHIAEQRHVRNCDLHETCTRGRVSKKVRSCKDCPDYSPEPLVNRWEGAAPPARTFWLPQSRLSTGPGVRTFNGGVTPYKGKRLLAYRTGWERAKAWVVEVDEQFRPRGASRQLAIDHPMSALGVDDPRLFTYRGKLHVSFTGVQRDKGGPNGYATNVGYARLSDDYEVEEVFFPDYAQRQHPFEKNWQFFECDGELYCVYSIRPHVVLKLDGATVARVYWTVNPFSWAGGLAHGGAPPVRVGGEFVHWFHGLDRSNDWHRYSIGAYRFEAKPPFRVTAFTPDPLLWASAEGRPSNQSYDVVFPSAAYLDEAAGRWVVSGDVHDVRLAAWEWASNVI